MTIKNIHLNLQLLKGLIAYPVDNYDYIYMISKLFIDYTSNIYAFLRPST